MKPIEQQQQRDGMPREVATAMLSEPRARITNTFRKQCMRAREKVFVSSSPIVKEFVGDNVVRELCWTERDGRSPEDHITRRFAVATLAQLGNWLRRSIARRAVVQRRYLAVVGDTMFAQSQRAALAEIAERLDIVRDVCEDVITMRADKCKQVVAVCTAHGTGKSVNFYPVNEVDRCYRRE